MKLVRIDENNKVVDVCSPGRGFWNRFESVLEVEVLNDIDVRYGDTWDIEHNCSLKDSPKRLEGSEKTEIEELKERIEKLEEVLLKK